MDKATIICRCEEINLGEIETAIKFGAQSFNDIKRITRCGMGQCQAKVCMNLVRDVISEFNKTPMDEIHPATMRMPLKIIRMESLANFPKYSNAISIIEESREKVGGHNNKEKF